MNPVQSVSIMCLFTSHASYPENPIILQILVQTNEETLHTHNFGHK